MRLAKQEKAKKNLDKKTERSVYIWGEEARKQITHKEKIARKYCIKNTAKSSNIGKEANKIGKRKKASERSRLDEKTRQQINKQKQQRA